MQFLILSDIHANWYALEAVLKSAGEGFDQIICCGDLVGYNPHPAQVVEWTRDHCNTVIRGNHDKVVAGIEQLEWFNPVAQAAARWTRDHMDEADLQYLHELQPGPLKLEHFHIWHGAPFDEDEYIIRPREAAACFVAFELPLAFFGHTHLQGGFYFRRQRVVTIAQVPRDFDDAVLQLEPDTQYLVNPGSVGQPRDGDARAAYAIYDSEQRTVEFRRVAYPVEKTAEELRAAGLPDALAARLFKGV
ncbi:MAG TPA: metallophosphoesterase family protein [Bryobacteraceae bacterium]|nr:metallophosphoesterase family protein [Bryobacteraceae bacterium]